MKLNSEQVELLYTVPSKTDDQGTWWPQLTDCSFASNTGWAFGSGQLLRTLDGGHTWRALRSPATGLHKIHAVDAWTAYLIGYTVPEFALWYTGDAGENWQKVCADQDLGSASVLFSYRGNFGITVSDRQRQGQQRLLLSKLGSNEWVETRPEIPGELESIVFEESGIGFMVVSICDPSEIHEQREIEKLAANDESIGIPLVIPKKSVIFGLNERLEPREISSVGNWVSNLLATKSALFAYGYGGIYRSLDGGESWHQAEIELPEGAGVNAIASGEDLMIAVGDFGYLAVSHDDGKSWEDCSLGPQGENYIAANLSGNDLILVGSRHISKLRVQHP